MTPEEAKERLDRISTKSVFDESLVGWEPITLLSQSTPAGLPDLITEYERISQGKPVEMVRMKNGKLQLWVRTERADLWKK